MTEYQGVRAAQSVVDACITLHGVSMERLTGSCRTKPVSDARARTYAALRALTDLSFMEISQLFNKPHTTAAEAAKRFQDTDGWLDRVRGLVPPRPQPVDWEKRRAESTDHCRRIQDIHSITKSESPARRSMVRSYTQSVVNDGWLP